MDLYEGRGMHEPTEHRGAAQYQYDRADAAIESQRARPARSEKRGVGRLERGRWGERGGHEKDRRV